MKRKELLATSLFFGVLLLVLNEVALYLGLFWAIWWLDLAFHGVGGFVAGGLLMGLFIDTKTPFWTAVLRVFFGTLFVALVWELYEFLLREVYTEEYIIDVITDILLGLAGGLATIYLVPRNMWGRAERQRKEAYE